jgi:NAD(P)-dependent dehydrogenase (short-subunit alcohol dehydrogenase family)
MRDSRNVLITGGGVRVGAHLALCLAEAGWNVALHCHRSVPQAEALAERIRALGRDACIVQGDLADAHAPARIMEQAQRALGAFSCLINNASQFRKDSLTAFTEESLQAHFAVNAFAPLRLIRAFTAQCDPKRENSVINIGDGLAGISMSPQFLTYTLSKLALENLTRLLAAELAPHIRINLIAPGPTLPGHMDKPDTFAKLRRALPLQRVSDCAELSSAVAFLLQAKSMTGQCLNLASGAEFVPTSLIPLD